MKCSYHPEVESQEACAICRKLLCSECVHRVKGKIYCQDCLAEGAEWEATVKGLRLPGDAPRRAAVCALIPGIGAVYNNENLKAIIYFAVFASLIMLGGVFIFGAIAFYIFTIFDAYRSAEFKNRMRIESGGRSDEPQQQDRTIIGWGILLIVLGVIFLLKNIVDYDFFSWLWPGVFILLGAYLVYHALTIRDNRTRVSSGSAAKPRGGLLL